MDISLSENEQAKQTLIDKYGWEREALELYLSRGYNNNAVRLLSVYEWEAEVEEYEPPLLDFGPTV